MIKIPPINTVVGGVSFKNNQTQKGANKVSVNIKIPTITAGVLLAPIVTAIKPKACWKVPSNRATPRSCVETKIVLEDKYPYKHPSNPE